MKELAIKELQKPLDRKYVATRKNYGGGPALSYLEGHHVIQEANRIFGHDGWSSETVQIERVASTPYVKRDQRKGDIEMIAVSYMARVRVTVGDTVREGCGYGDGQAAVDKAGQAHELALKEAETDARKRALMTYGDPFGLALYDKTQARVVDVMPETKANSRDIFARLVDALREKETVEDVDAWLANPKVDKAIRSLASDWQSNFDEEILQHKNTLMDKAAAA